MDDNHSPRFGLPSSLWIPIAAVSVSAVEEFVGEIVDRRVGPRGRVNALRVKPKNRLGVEGIPRSLKRHPLFMDYWQRLHPEHQVWVHVDYSGYRRSYATFKMPLLMTGYVLDHVQNREAIRIRDYSHPYLRLCPVAHSVNTNAGGLQGGEGMEKASLRKLKDGEPERWKEFLETLKFPIVYADPMDMTKILDISPGTFTLDGVRDIQSIFFDEVE